jgi:hypothetical protein
MPGALVGLPAIREAEKKYYADVEEPDRRGA